LDKEALYEFFRALDRSKFIDSEYRDMAKIDRPLPIGYGQTISQPTLVAQMTYLLSPYENCSVLEIGTGSGYQTALLAQFSGTVYTVERIAELQEKAKIRLLKLGFRNIFYKTGDGSEGWAEHAPFDRIIVTAAAEKLPQDLVEQLSCGGRMIVPVGPQGLQELLLVVKDGGGKVSTEPLGQVVFVEMKGKYGWS